MNVVMRACPVEPRYIDTSSCLAIRTCRARKACTRTFTRSRSSSSTAKRFSCRCSICSAFSLPSTRYVGYECCSFRDYVCRYITGVTQGDRREKVVPWVETDETIAAGVRLREKLKMDPRFHFVLVSQDEAIFRSGVSSFPIVLWLAFSS